MKIKVFYLLSLCIISLLCSCKNSKSSKTSESASVKSITTESKTKSDKDINDWFTAKVWKQGWNVKADESLNIKDFAYYYFKNPDRWNKAFKFLAKNNLKAIKTGKYEIDGKNLFAAVSEYESKDENNAKIEAHKKYADIQYVITGEEQIGVLPLENMKPFIPYSDKKDVEFFKTDMTNYYHHADSSNFFIFFPNDAHRPGVKIDKNTPIKKIVIKVKLL